jgi:glycine/D-amino acid oxidase-like deaminating enzyme
MSRCDYLVVGGGFYGCCLALFLRSISERVTLVEAGPRLMERASRVNQARVHTGFHYPRNVLTAAKSLVLHSRFAADFPDAVIDDFQMLYAIARHRSRVGAKRFLRMFTEMGAPIVPASRSQSALFEPAMVEAVFACKEYAFDFSVLRDHLARRLDSSGVDLRLGTSVIRLEEKADSELIATLSAGEPIRAGFGFNVTYAQTNQILRTAGLPEASLKHELTEIALVSPPEELRGYGITVMDGPFFSTMPFPSENLYSLTHVRYTPHRSWTDQTSSESAYEILRSSKPESRFPYMIQDARRFVPSLGGMEWVRSMYEVKTLLVKNESDDGRPILYHRRPSDSRLVSVMGGKIDNIYDLFDLVKTTDEAFACADDRHVYTGERRP